jgi:hypothetical protein
MNSANQLPVIHHADSDRNIATAPNVPPIGLGLVLARAIGGTMSSPHIYSSSIGLLSVCRNHSALTQTRVWQCPVSPPLRDSRLDGGALLFLPFFSFNI